MEKSELELQAKQSELESAQTRLMTVEDQLRDIKKHHIIMKETCNAKEQQLNLMQSDVRLRFCFFLVLGLLMFTLEHNTQLDT